MTERRWERFRIPAGEDFLFGFRILFFPADSPASHDRIFIFFPAERERKTVKSVSAIWIEKSFVQEGI
jgi:hypothetical protein